MVGPRASSRKSGRFGCRSIADPVSAPLACAKLFPKQRSPPGRARPRDRAPGGRNMPEPDSWTGCLRLEAANRCRVQDGATMVNKSPVATSPPEVGLTAKNNFPITFRFPVRFRGFWCAFRLFSNHRDSLESFYLQRFRERRRRESNPRITVLQTIALPLGYSAVHAARGAVIMRWRSGCQCQDFLIM